MWLPPIVLTVQLIMVSTTIAVVWGVAVAWAASMLRWLGRSGRVLASFSAGAMVASLATPLILHAAAWEATAGKFGWVPLTQTGNRTLGNLGGSVDFGGLIAAGWIHGVFGISLVALATWYATESIPRRIVEAGRMDAGPGRLWWSVRLPIAIPWVVASALAVALIAATEMTVVDLYGFRTLADQFYLFHAIDPTATSIVMTLLIPAILGGILAGGVWLGSRRSISVDRGDWPDRGDLVAEQSRSASSSYPAWGDPPADKAPASEAPPGPIKFLAVLLVVSAVLLVSLVPLLGLLIKAGHEVSVVEDRVRVSWSLVRLVETTAEASTLFAKEYVWTAVIAGLTGLAAVALAWPLACWRRHCQIEGASGQIEGASGKAGVVIDLLSIAVVLVPGPLVGLAVVRLFQLDFAAVRVLYQQTLLPTVIALLFRAGPVAYWILRSGYRGISDRVLESAALDFSLAQRIWMVDRPLLGRALATAFIASAVVASGDVPATLPVIPPGVSTVGTRLFGLLHSGARYQEAALALWYIAAVVLASLLAARWLRQRGL